MVRSELTALFTSSASEKLAKLRNLIGHLSRNFDDADAWEKLENSLEFLSSEAQQATFPEFRFVLQAMKSLPVALREGRFSAGPVHVHFLLILLDYLDGMVVSEQVVSLVPQKRIQEIASAIDAREVFTLKGLSLEEQKNKKPEAVEAETFDSDESVRISLSQLETLTGKLDAVVVRQFQLKKHLDLLQSIEDSVRRLASDIKDLSVEVVSPELEIGVESLLKDVRRLDLGFKEDMTSLDRSAFQFQEELAKFRMVPFELAGSDWETLNGLSQNKADLAVDPSKTLLDKALLKVVQEPLWELVRNALAHGIESASVRKKQGKPERGKVRVSCHSDGSSISVEVSDDGRGIDVEELRASAQAIFPVEKDELAVMPATQLFGYLFEPGVTTVGKKTSLLSGDGLGLELVKKALDLLQGRIQVTSSPGAGSTFLLQFPASLSLIQGFFIRAGGEKFFVSSVFVREIVIFRRSELSRLPNGYGYRLRDLVVPVLPLSSVFEGKDTVQKPVEEMIIVEFQGETFGLLVDAIVRHAALTYKALPDTLTNLREIQGVVYDERFNLVPILHVPAVLIHLRRLRSLEFRDRYSPDRLDLKNVLVVDDSPVSRETVLKVLKGGGFSAEGVEDGIAAMEILQDRHYHLIVTDEEMPRMDGPTFVENLRKQPEYAQSPVIALVGALNADAVERWKDRGVSVVLEKANFSRQELLDRVTSLLGRTL